MEKLQLVGEWFLGEIEKPPEVTKGGIIIPKPKEEKEKEKTKRVKVLAVGEEVDTKDLRVGDWVMVHQTSGLECEEFGHLFKKSNIMAILRKEDEPN